MARGKGIWQVADASKRELSAQTQKRIQKIYTDAYNDTIQRIKDLDLKDQTLVSVSMKRTYLNQVEADLLSATNNISRSLQQEITWASYTSADIPVKATQATLKKAGLDLAGAYSHVPKQVVENLASGSLYEGKWNLSSAIWKAGEKTKSDVQELIAKGLAENLSTAEISKSLEQYLLPGARKPWDWNKVYPGTSKKVDYNAQRLARTMIQHSYQQALIETNKDNPWCDGIIWHSAHSSRVCAICAERDGQVFPVLELPLDHPNGMCFFEPATADLKKISDDLADWVNTGSNSNVEKYLESAYGYVPQVGQKTPTGAGIVNGTNLVGTWKRRPDEFDFEIEDVINAQGFDGLPRVVSEEEFNAAVKESKFIAQRTYSAPSDEILDTYRDMLYNGKWYVDCSTGGAQYGQGMYCAADYEGILSKGIKEEIEHYKDMYTISDMTMDDSAKIRLLQNALRKEGYTDASELRWAEAFVKKDHVLSKELMTVIDDDTRQALNDVLRYAQAPSYTETLTLHPSAKIIKYDEIRPLYDKAIDKYVFDYAESHFDTQIAKDYFLSNISYDYKPVTEELIKYNEELKETGKLQEFRKELHNFRQDFEEYEDTIRHMDMGAFAALNGYDAINAVGHGASGSYTVVLNRTKLIIKNPK